MNTDTQIQLRVAKKMEPVDARLLAALCVSSFLASLNFYAMTPFFSIIARDLDTSIPRLGLVTTSIILISAALGLLVGPLSDRYGYRWPLTIGVFAVAVNLAGAGLAPSYPALLAISIFGGLADAFVFGLPLAIAGTRFSGDAQRRAMGWTLASLSAAPIIGVPILTAIGDAASWRVALVSAGCFAACTAIFVTSAVPPDVRRESRFRIDELRSAYAPLLHHHSSLRLYAANALRSVTWIGFLTYLGAFLSDEMGFQTREIGLVFTVGGIGAAAGSIFGGRLHFRSQRSLVAMCCIVTSIICALTLLVASPWIAIPAVLIFCFATAVGGLAIATLLVNESPAETGTTMVLNGSLMNLGAAGGAAFGGLLLGLGGYTALGFGLPVFAVVAAVLARWPSHR